MKICNKLLYLILFVNVVMSVNAPGTPILQRSITSFNLPLSRKKAQTEIESTQQSPKMKRKILDNNGNEVTKIPTSTSRSQPRPGGVFVRYMEPIMLKKITGESNLMLVTKIDLSCSPEKSGNCKIPFLEYLGHIPNLVEINLNNNSLTRCDRLADLTYLQRIYVAHNQIATLEGLSNLVNLTIMDFSYNLIQKIPNYFTKRFKSLRQFHIAGNRIDSLHDIIKLKSIPSLIHLNIQDNPVALTNNCRGMLVYSLPNVQILNQVEISNDEKEKAIHEYSRETLSYQENEITELRNRVKELEANYSQASKENTSYTERENRLTEELSTTKKENTKLDMELQAKQELLNKKTTELGRSHQQYSKLENELSFYKLDQKLDPDRLQDVYPPEILTDSENSDTDFDIPYVGMATFKPMSTVHRTRIPRDAKTSVYHPMSPQFAQKMSVFDSDPSDPAFLAKMVQDKEQEIQIASNKIERIRSDLTYTDKQLQTVRSFPEVCQIVDEAEIENLQRKLAEAREELMSIKEKIAAQNDDPSFNNSFNGSMSMASTGSMAGTSNLIANATEEESLQLAALMADKTTLVQELEQKMRGGEEVGIQEDMLQMEIEKLDTELKQARSELDILIQDKAEQVDNLHQILNVSENQISIANIQTDMDFDAMSKLDDLHHQIATQQTDIQDLLTINQKLENDKLAAEVILNDLTKETSEQSCHAGVTTVDQSTATQNYSAILGIYFGESVNIPTTQLPWEEERNKLLNTQKELEQELKSSKKQNQVLQDAIKELEVEKLRLQQIEDGLRTEIDGLKQALDEFEIKLDVLEHELNASHDREAEKNQECEELTQERDSLLDRFGQTTDREQRLEDERNRLFEKVTQLRDALSQSEEEKKTLLQELSEVKQNLSEREEQLVQTEYNIDGLREHISEIEKQICAHSQKGSIETQTVTPPQPDIANILENLESLLATITQQDDPELVAETIRLLSQEDPTEFREENIVTDLNNAIADVFEKLGGELVKLREQLMDAEAELAEEPDIIPNFEMSTQTYDPSIGALEQEVENLQNQVESLQEALQEAERRPQLFDVETQVRPRTTSRPCQVNIPDYELMQDMNELQQDRDELANQLEQQDALLSEKDLQLRQIDDDLTNLQGKYDALKSHMLSVASQTSPQLINVAQMTNGVLEQASQTRNNGHSNDRTGELSELGDEMEQLRSMVAHLQDTHDRLNEDTQHSRDDIGIQSRPDQHNASMQADFVETGNVGMQTYNPEEMGMQTDTLFDSTYTQTMPISFNAETQCLDDEFENLPDPDPNHYFDEDTRPPKRFDNHTNAHSTNHLSNTLPAYTTVSTSTRRTPGTSGGPRHHVHDIYFDDEASETSDESESEISNPGSDLTTRVHYRTTRGAQTKKNTPRKKISSHSDTELHKTTYITRKAKHRKPSIKKSRKRQPSSNKTFVIVSGSEADSIESESTEVELYQNDYIYLPTRDRKSKHRRIPRGDKSSNLNVFVSKPSKTHHHKYNNREHYFCNVPSHAFIEEEIERLEELICIAESKGRRKVKQSDNQTSLLERLTEITLLLKDRLDSLGNQQKKHTRLSNQMSKQQDMLVQTANELSEASNELKGINQTFRCRRTNRLDDVTGQISHGHITPQLDSLQTRLDRVSAALEKAERLSEIGNSFSNDELNRINSMKQEITRYNNQIGNLENELVKIQEKIMQAKIEFESISEKKTNTQFEYNRALDETIKQQNLLNDLRHACQKQETKLRQTSFDSLSEQNNLKEALINCRAENDQLKKQTKAYKKRVQYLEQPNTIPRSASHIACQSEIQYLETELNRTRSRQEEMKYDLNTQHNNNVNQILEKLQNQLTSLTFDISSDLEPFDQNEFQNNPPYYAFPSKQILKTDMPLTDTDEMRTRKHETLLKELKREHEELLKYIQNNHHEGERNVLDAQHEAMQGAYDLSRKIEFLQHLIEKSKLDNNQQQSNEYLPTAQFETELKSQQILINQLNKKVDSMAKPYSKSRPNSMPPNSCYEPPIYSVGEPDKSMAHSLSNGYTYNLHDNYTYYDNDPSLQYNNNNHHHHLIRSANNTPIQTSLDNHNSNNINYHHSTNHGYMSQDSSILSDEPTLENSYHLKIPNSPKHYTPRADNINTSHVPHSSPKRGPIRQYSTAYPDEMTRSNSMHSTGRRGSRVGGDYKIQYMESHNNMPTMQY